MDRKRIGNGRKIAEGVAALNYERKTNNPAGLSERMPLYNNVTGWQSSGER